MHKINGIVLLFQRLGSKEGICTYSISTAIIYCEIIIKNYVNSVHKHQFQRKIMNSKDYSDVKLKLKIIFISLGQQTFLKFQMSFAFIQCALLKYQNLITRSKDVQRSVAAVSSLLKADGVCAGDTTRVLSNTPGVSVCVWLADHCVSLQLRPGRGRAAEVCSGKWTEEIPHSF